MRFSVSQQLGKLQNEQKTIKIFNNDFCKLNADIINQNLENLNLNIIFNRDNLNWLTKFVERRQKAYSDRQQDLKPMRHYTDEKCLELLQDLHEQALNK